MLGILRIVCTVVGAVVLYGALMAALWTLVMRTAKHRVRIAAERRSAARRAAAASIVTEPRDPAADPRDRRARSWEELPTWLWRDRPWAVAVVLLGAPAVRDRTAPFVDFPNRVIDWAALLGESREWPPDQRLLVQSAYEMAFDTPGELTRSLSHPVSLRDVVLHLDDDEVERIRVAMQIRRGRLEPEDGLTALS